MLRVGVASPYSTKRFARAELRAPTCPPGWRVGPPDFVGVGTQRSGTKWWYENVVGHPGVTRVSGPHKELHFFDGLSDVDLSPEWVERYHRFFPRPGGTIAGEWTPRYMANFWTPGLLHEAAPEARLLVLLRDPVERYLSGVALESFRASARGDVPVTLARVFRFLGVDPCFTHEGFGTLSNVSTEKRPPTRVGAWLKRERGGAATRTMPARLRRRAALVLGAFGAPPPERRPVLSDARREQLEGMLREDADRLRAVTGCSFPTWSV